MNVFGRTDARQSFATVFDPVHFKCYELFPQAYAATFGNDELALCLSFFVGFLSASTDCRFAPTISVIESDT